MQASARGCQAPVLQQVDDALPVLPRERDWQSGRGKSLAPGVDAIEQFEDALIGKLGENFTHSAANEATVAARNLDIGIVDVFEAVVGPRKHGREPRHLLQHAPLPCGFFGGSSLRKHALGRLGHEDKHARRRAGFIRHRRIVEIHPGRIELTRILWRARSKASART